MELSKAMSGSACDLAAQGQAQDKPHRMAIATVIVCQAALEAYLNEDLEHYRWTVAAMSGSTEAWNVVLEAVEGASIEQRWLAIPQLRWGRTFDRSREPFQSFHLLIALRNTLVHYAPRSADFFDFPNKKVENLASRFAFTAPAKQP